VLIFRGELLELLDDVNANSYFLVVLFDLNFHREKVATWCIATFFNIVDNSFVKTSSKPPAPISESESVVIHAVFLLSSPYFSDDRVRSPSNRSSSSGAHAATSNSVQG
jgi:hypothetical protein